MKVYLVRHGESEGNIRGTMMGWGDHPLTDHGLLQARAVAARLLPFGPMAVVCSDLVRARATAEMIALAWDDARDGVAGPASRVVRSDDRLREIGIGEFEGRTWDEFTADIELAAALERDLLGTKIPGGESLAEVTERVMKAFREAVARAADEGSDSVCIVGHDGTIRAVLNDVLHVPADRFWALRTSHGGVSLLEVEHDWVEVHYVNDTSHLVTIGTED